MKESSNSTRETQNAKPETPPPSPSSASPAADKHSQTPRRGGKPFQPLPEFASLSREQLDYIHDLLRGKTYEDAQQEIWVTLGCRISTNRLQRYREKIDLAAALEIAGEDTIPAVDQLNNLLAGRESNIAAAGMLLIQQRALALAASPKTSPTLLKDLFRIFTYEDRKSDNAHRRQIAEQREATRKRLADLAERKHADAQKRAELLQSSNRSPQRASVPARRSSFTTAPCTRTATYQARRNRQSAQRTAPRGNT